MISPAKSIPCNEIKIKLPTRNPPNPIPPEACLQAARPKLSTSLLLFTAESSVRTCGNFSSLAGGPFHLQARTGDASSGFHRNGTEKQTLSLS